MIFLVSVTSLMLLEVGHHHHFYADHFNTDRQEGILILTLWNDALHRFCPDALSACCQSCKDPPSYCTFVRLIRSDFDVQRWCTERPTDGHIRREERAVGNILAVMRNVHIFIHVIVRLLLVLYVSWVNHPLRWHFQRACHFFEMISLADTKSMRCKKEKVCLLCFLDYVSRKLWVLSHRLFTQMSLSLSQSLRCLIIFESYSTTSYPKCR